MQALDSPCPDCGGQVARDAEIGCVSCDWKLTGPIRKRTDAELAVTLENARRSNDEIQADADASQALKDHFQFMLDQVEAVVSERAQ